jgi:hypothetical protein
MNWDEENMVDQLRSDLARATAELDEARMEAGRLQARCSVFMQAMAWLARHNMQGFAKQWVERADAASLDVRPEDFVVAHVNGARQAPPSH